VLAKAGPGIRFPIGDPKGVRTTTHEWTSVALHKCRRVSNLRIIWSLLPFGDTNLCRKPVPLPQPATKEETYGCADTGYARHLGKRDAGVRRNREKGWFTQPVS